MQDVRKQETLMHVLVDSYTSFKKLESERSTENTDTVAFSKSSNSKEVKAENAGVRVDVSILQSQQK